MIKNIDVIKEYYNKFPEPYKTQVLINLEKYPKGSLRYGYIPNIKESLYRGFYWECTGEGFDYWYKFSNSLIDLKITFVGYDKYKFAYLTEY